MVKSGQVWTGSFATTDSTGALLASTTAPTAVLYVNGVSNAAAVTVTGANPYKWSVTLPALTAGDTVEIYASATIATIPVSQYVAAATADTSRPSDVVAELAKVPKSDGAVSWNATALAAILTQVNSALNVAIPGSPTADSINERVKAIDDRILGTLAAGTHTAQTGDSYPVVTHTDYGNAKLVRSTTPANTLDVSASGEAGLDFANVKAATSPTTLTNITVPVVTTLTNMPAAAPSAADVGEEIWTGAYTREINSVSGSIGGNVEGKVLGGGAGVFVANGVQVAASGGTGLTAQETADAVHNLAPIGVAAIGSMGANLDSILNGLTGVGLIPLVYTVTEPGGIVPIPGVTVELYTEEACLNCARRGVTDSFGVVTFWMSTAGTYWIKSAKDGYSFELDSETVAA